MRETDTFKVYAQNNYIAPLTKVVLIAKTEDEGIQVSISPEMVARLNPGERTEFTVTLDTKDKQARDLNVDFAIDARELKMRPIQDPTDEELRDVLKTTYLCGSASDRPEKSSHLHFAERRLPEPAANQTKYRRSSGGHLLKSHGETNNDGNRESREKPPELGVMPGRRRRKSAPIAAFYRTVGSGPPIAFTRRTSCKAKLDDPRYRSRSSQTRTTRTPQSRPENRKTRGTDVRNVSYRELFPALINNWRCDFRNFDMPFYFVQLANFTEGGKPDEVKPYRGEPRDHELAELRESQFMANQLKNTGMAVTIDVGDSHNIHPSNKKDCGERLALWAVAKDYGKDVIYSGPLYAGYAIEEGQIRVYFDHAESALVFRDGKAKGFAIAGKDRKFVWGDAKIEGETVVVSSDKVKEPVAVRYGWDIDPEVSLYNKAGLPASPFRTDDWNGLTFGKLLPKR